ncbi:hypothetical protein MYX84_00415 [Acidobacteria bacterium AH-259-O06]|nr:hypothetical protein [Acidobacteria bacterium AH-259-O06]
MRGVSRVLQQAHLPFGIITRRQLDRLSDYKLVILPNVLRMDEEEVAAFRDYVRRGGFLYASGETSLTTTEGHHKEDFMLADVFGCHLQDEVPLNVNYIKPGDEALKQAVAPQDYVSEVPESMLSTIASPPKGGGTQILLAENPEGEPLATLTYPYGNPDFGSVFDRRWQVFIVRRPGKIQTIQWSFVTILGRVVLFTRRA